jgi:hypothetical protein
VPPLVSCPLVYVCRGVSIFSSSLLGHHHIETELSLSLSFTSHHRPLPHLTSHPHTAYIPPSHPTTYSYPLLSSHLFSPWLFSLPKVDTGLILLCTETRFLVVGIARDSVQNCCGQHFFELHTSTTSLHTVQLFLLGVVGLRIRYTSVQLRVNSPPLHRFTSSLPQHHPAAAKRRHYETAGYTVPSPNCLCLISATSRFL